MANTLVYGVVPSSILRKGRMEMEKHTNNTALGGMRIRKLWK
jgi:hypothetical protein